MSKDRPLTEFSVNEATAETDSSSEETNPVKPASVTYRSRPEGFACAVCGAETTTQWFDGGRFVCPDCKSWG